MAGALHERLQRVERRRRAARGHGLERADHQLHLHQRVAPGGADPRRRLLRAAGVEPQDLAGAGGLDDHDADAVRDDVVHLARDPAALVGDRLARGGLALLGQPRRALVQLRREPRARADVAADEPAERR